MAKKQNVPTRTKLEEVNEQMTTVAEKLENSKKYIYWGLTIVLALILLGAGYYYLIKIPNEKKAVNQIGKADIAMMQGNTEQALQDYQKVADAFSNEPANRAKLNAAILLYNQGKNQEAAKYLEDFDPNGDLVGPAGMSLLGDCYVNMKQYDKALNAYDKAVTLCKGNELFAPTFMIKKATVLREQKKYDQEAAIYQTIKDQYPVYAQQFGVNIDKYLERANAQAGK